MVSLTLRLTALIRAPSHPHCHPPPMILGSHFLRTPKVQLLLWGPAGRYLSFEEFPAPLSCDGRFSSCGQLKFFLKLPSSKKPKICWKKVGFLSFPCPRAPFKRLAVLLCTVFPTGQGALSFKGAKEIMWAHKSQHMEHWEKEFSESEL